MQWHTSPKYEVIGVSKEKDREYCYWRIDIGIRKPWPLSWIDHPPWKRICKRKSPVRTFIGKGFEWAEVESSEGWSEVIPLTRVRCFRRRYIRVLNAIVSRHTAEKKFVEQQQN